MKVFPDIKRRNAAIRADMRALSVIAKAHGLSAASVKRIKASR